MIIKTPCLGVQLMMHQHHVIFLYKNIIKVYLKGGTKLFLLNYSIVLGEQNMFYHKSLHIKHG